MKNINIKNTLIIILMAVFTISCERDLDLLPLDTLTTGAFFQSENDFKTYANGLYRQLPDYQTASNDNSTDLFYTGGGNSLSNGTNTEPQNSDNWNNPYANIRSALELIEREAALEAGNIKDAVQVYKGEAHFFVAMNYFNLLRLYGGVPLINRTVELEDELLTAPRASRTEIVNYIMENLDLAIQNVGTLTGASDIGRVTKDAARAFKARVALFEGTWRKFHELGDENSMLDIAINETRTVIESGNHSLFKNSDLGDLSYFYFFILQSGVQSNPVGLGKDAQNEYILTRKHNVLDFPSNYISVNSGNLSPTLKMANMFLDNTGLPIDHANSVFEGHSFIIDPDTKVVNNIEYNNRDPRMIQMFIQPFEQFWYHSPYHRDFSNQNLLNTGAWNDGYWTSATGYMIKKFLPQIEGAVAIDWPIIRLAEVMLIYAEAVFERNGSISDADLNISINALRDRVDMPRLTNDFVSANGLDMRTEIRRERAVELMAEGFRYDDLRRWKTAIYELGEALKGIQYQNSPLSDPNGAEVFNVMTGELFITTVGLGKTFPGGLDAEGFSVLEAASDRNFAERNYLWPIPLKQIQLNPNLEQNPGWANQ